MKNREIIEHINALGNFTKEKVPVKLSFAIVKNFNSLKAAYKDYDEARTELVAKYSEKAEAGNAVKNENGTENIATEHAKDWNREINDLLDIDVNVDVHMIDYALFDNLELSVSDVEAICFMIKE